MERLTLEISDEVFQKLLPYRDRLQELIMLGLQQIRIQEVLLLYSRGLVSLGRAAELAGISEKEMILQARAFDAQPRWSEQMVREELA